MSKKKPNLLREVVLDPLQKVAHAVTPSEAALRAARKRNMGLLVTTTIASALFLSVGAYHAYLDPTNPAVWMLLGLWSMPLLLVLYHEFYALRMPKERRQPRLISLGITYLWAILTGGMTAELARQAEGTFTLIFWSVILGLFWLLVLLGVDYAFEGRPHKALRDGILALMRPTGGGD